MKESRFSSGSGCPNYTDTRTTDPEAMMMMMMMNLQSMLHITRSFEDSVSATQAENYGRMNQNRANWTKESEVNCV